MKRFLIGSCIVGFLAASAPAFADSYYKHRTPPGIQIVVERGHALPPGHQKKYLAAKYRDGHHYHDHHGKRYGHKKHGYRDHKHHGHSHHSHKYRYKDEYHYRDRGHSRYRDDYRHKPYYGYRDHIPTEHRVARIIRDTQALIDESRRRH